jgi:hypothetical protein
MGLKDQLRHLKRKASRNAVLIRQRDGSVKPFDRMTVAKELFVARLNHAVGDPAPSGPVMDALANATPSPSLRVWQMGRGGTFLEFVDDSDFEPGEVEDLSE